MKKRLLLVDDDRFVLAALRRSLRSCRDKWDVEFAASGREALERMADQAFDVIVSDMRMPGMSGAELLGEVRSRYPQTVRIMLSGQLDQDLRMRAVESAHKCLSKPCDPVTLQEAIEGACVVFNEVVCHE